MKSEDPKQSLALADWSLVRHPRRAEFGKTWRDVALPLFRQRKLVVLIFSGVFCGAMLAALFMPRKFEAEMKIFVNRDRADAVVTPDMNTAVAPVPAVSQEDMNSEVELLTSSDLLDKVVLNCGLVQNRSNWWTRVSERLRGGGDSPDARLAESEQALRNALTVEPLQKTTIIRVAYSSRNPRTAAHVLQTLATLYQEKHAAVHRPAGSFSFFEQQTARFGDQLADAEARRIAFDQKEGVVEPAVEQQLELQQLSKFQAELLQNQSDAYAAGARARALRAEETSAPKRQTTEMRQSGNAQLLAQLRSTLLSLELKHTDMLVKYAPSYPPVKDLESQIAQTQEAIQVAERSPVSEVTTDRVPAQDWIATELAKVDADRAQFAARADALEGTVRHYQTATQRLDQIDATQADLTRTVKTAEDNYLLYLRKREEARISDALDERRIVNVSLAEAPTVPALPTEHFGWLLLGGLFTAGITSVGAAYAADRMDSSFRTPDELNRYLDLKVLAAIPRSTSGD
jgi:uncharacterized protein involved in exopolysaccharide biosynthesis